MGMTMPYALIDSDHGLSDEAEWLRQFFEPGPNVSYSSAAICGPQWDLEDARREASEANWDGYGAKAVSESAYFSARDFLHAFTGGQLPAPEISASPRGEILLEWSTGPRHIFTLAFGEKGDKYYAGLFGTNKVSGREDLLDRFVAIAAESLARLYPTRRHAA
jgi:hypothetical protein